MNWLDWAFIIALTLTNLWTARRFSSSSHGLDTQEVETLQDLVVRLAAENRAWGQKYARLEQDYQGSFQEIQTVRGQLERRTKALESCRNLLASQQGIEDSSP